MKIFSGRLLLAITLAAMPYILCAGGAVEYALYSTREKQPGRLAIEPVLFASNAITPQHAESVMRNALEMLDIPSSFKPQLRHLLMKFKNHASEKNAVWGPQSIELYMHLVHFQTLFTMLNQQNIPPAAPAILLGLDRAGILPQNPCMTLLNTVNNPEWQAVRGKKFAAAVILLPCKYHLQGSLTASAAVAASGSGSVAVKLQRVDYFIQNTSWGHRLSNNNSISRGDGMKIFLLHGKFDQSLAPGIYNGSITFTPSGNAKPVRMQYTILLN